MDGRGQEEFNIGTTLAYNGCAGLSINYVLATKDKPAWPQNLHDCKTAVRWLRKNADRLQIDPDRIGVLGGSAGGHLAAMVGVTGPADGLDLKEPYGDISCRVRCAVDMYGPGDLTLLVVVEGAPHTFLIQPKEKDLRPAVLVFFDEHLKPAK